MLTRDLGLEVASAAANVAPLAALGRARGRVAAAIGAFGCSASRYSTNEAPMNFLRNLVPTALRATPGAGVSPAFAAARSLLGGVRWMGMTRPGIKKWKRIRRIRRRIKKGSWRAPASYVLEAKRVIAGWNAARLGTEVVETEDPIRRKYVPVTVVPRV